MSRENVIGGVGVLGTIATWSLQGVLSLIATVCTIIVVGPTAWARLVEWYKKYSPPVRAFVLRIFRSSP